MEYLAIGRLVFSLGIISCTFLSSTFGFINFHAAKVEFYYSQNITFMLSNC